ncbi:uncharacterized protein LOC106881042 isoform X2 [Octopus bimaculoides]|uniref:Uncharacterized protein n=1 Tax=Octopus bimaculoides TaxID=37653 RepID=A0A0L8FUK8_OCTBM|nr:uncharacterized protein LOC106881042 isoform X2 [Octopus bimaculoides]|eukprot:XP_014786732.1 PREDICTED: uncharacterized protein LOC106881042 isoform X2 [Octopus bimaculoides]
MLLTRPAKNVEWVPLLWSVKILTKTHQQSQNSLVGSNVAVTLEYRFRCVPLILVKRNCGTCSVQYEKESHQRKLSSRNNVRHYPENTRSIPVTIHLQLFQHGYFEFRICSSSNISTVIDADCLKTDKLKIKESGSTLYYPQSKGWHHINLELFQEIKCNQCVLQWKYKTSRCENGSEGRVCGYEMQFYNCADIAFDKLIPNNGAEEEEMKFQNTRKNGRRRKKRNALPLSSKICKPNEMCRRRSVLQSLFSKNFLEYNDSSSVMTESISATLLMSENLLASHGALHEDELSLSEPGSASGHYLNLLEPSDFSDYGSGGVQSGDHRSNAFSVEASATTLESRNLNAINQIRKNGTNENKDISLKVNMSLINKKKSASIHLNSSRSINISEWQKTAMEMQSQAKRPHQKLSSSDGERRRKLRTNATLTDKNWSLGSNSLVAEESLPITAPPQLLTKDNYSGAKKTNNSLISLSDKTNTMVPSKRDETNKQLTATEKIDLTIFPTTAIQQHSSGTNDSIPKRSDKTKTKEKNNCTDGDNCAFKKHECEKRIECSQTQNGTILCVTVESCSLITDIFQGLPHCSGHGKTLRCRGRGIYRYMKGISSWCEKMCRNQGCQLSVCNCDCRRIVSCGAVGLFRIVPGSTIWCQINCANNYCPSTHCGCQ